MCASSSSSSKASSGSSSSSARKKEGASTGAVSASVVTIDTPKAQEEEEEDVTLESLIEEVDDAMSSSSSSSKAVAKAPAKNSVVKAVSMKADAKPAKPDVVKTTDATLCVFDPQADITLPEFTNRPETEKLPIIFATSEVTPWSKSGGLADVCGSLPFALARRAHRVMVIAPRYENYEDAIDTGARIGVPCYGGFQEVGIFHCIRAGVDFVFVDHPSFHRPEGGLYTDADGEAYEDNAFRFTLLAKASLEIPLQVPLNGELYGDAGVFVANDWQAGLLPVLMASVYRPHHVYQNARTVTIIHNIQYQGVYSPGIFQDLGIPDDWFGAVDYQFPPEERQGAYEEEGHSVNFLKAAISTSDRVVTVSPNYANEICTWLGGKGMDDLLNARRFTLSGITNGIDVAEWDPATDRHLGASADGTEWGEHYSRGNLAGKAACKRALQQEMALPEDPNAPLIGFVGRLSDQKGAGMLLDAIPHLVEVHNAQVVMLGTGNKDLEERLREMEHRYQNNVRGWVGFNVAKSHHIIAAADLFAMPSRFEPCGLTQLYSLRYGTIPVVAETGGLVDTVQNYNPHASQEEERGTGFTFAAGDGWACGGALERAIKTYREHPESFKEMQLRGMAQDMSWDVAAESYEQVFFWAKNDTAFC